MAFRLFCVDNEEIYRDFSVNDVVLGRTFAMEMYSQLPEITTPNFDFVSRDHAHIYYGSGEFGAGYYLEPLGKNGTCIDGRDIKKSELWKLCEGNVIRFGNSEMNAAPAFLFREIR
jgi:pSer/pThr/pTyr-binding forkhead associated (FHA) protein